MLTFSSEAKNFGSPSIVTINRQVYYSRQSILDFLVNAKNFFSSHALIMNWKWDKIDRILAIKSVNIFRFKSTVNKWKIKGIEIKFEMALSYDL